MKRRYLMGIVSVLFFIGLAMVFLSFARKFGEVTASLESARNGLQQKEQTIANLQAERDQLTAENERLTNEFYDFRSRVGKMGTAQPSSPLSSYVPDNCPPSDQAPTTHVEGDYSITYLGCGDANWWYQATLVRNATSSKDIIAYRLSNQGLTWKTLNGKEHVLTTIGNRAWDSFQEYGRENPATVTDLTLDGKRLHILEEPFTYKDGGLGAFQDVYFLVGTNHLTATLLLQNKNYTIDFERATVRIEQTGWDR